MLHHLSVGAVAGSVVGSIIACIIVSSAVYLLIRKITALLAIKADETPELGTVVSQAHEMEGTMVKQELDGTQHLGQELDGRIHIGYEVEASENWVLELFVQENNTCEMPS